MAGFEASKAMQLTNAQREGAAALFSSARADANDMAQAIRWAWENCGELIDPHTAIAACTPRAQRPRSKHVPVVTLGDRAPGQVPRCGGARHRQQRPVLPGADRRPVPARGTLRRTARAITPQWPTTSRATRCQG
jgi:threonine synthase